jgi:hypothetical protein
MLNILGAHSDCFEAALPFFIIRLIYLAYARNALERQSMH